MEYSSFPLSSLSGVSAYGLASASMAEVKGGLESGADAELAAGEFPTMTGDWGDINSS